ncbi:carbohydrate ABC transporter permease [Streptomyces sp. NPDC057382]|uniref:carbohydrate ABC transporter permease n=1 Tax=unclassified Streptomyces TaxID=2593676 RepID=UPI00363EF3E0
MTHVSRVTRPTELGRPVPTAPPRSPARPARRAWKREAVAWLYLAVPLALLLVFTYVPVVNMLYYSVTDWDGVSPDKNVVGAENYVKIFTRPELFGVLTVSLFYMAGAVLQMAVALYFATVLSFNVRFRGFFKGMIFFPHLINGVAIGFIFLYFFKPDGTLDSVLEIVGIKSSNYWLGDPDLVNPSLSFTSLWRYVGLNFVLFLGAIQSIPDQLYDAASLDGANKWQQFRHIIAPSIRPILSLSFILAISGSLSVFEIPYIMTGGANGSKTFVIQTVDLAFKFNKVGLASAAAVVLLVIILAVTWVQRRLVPDEKVDLI